MSYWKSALVANEVLNIAVDKRRNPVSQSSARKTIDIQLGTAKFSCQHPGLSSCLLAAFQVFLQRLSSQEEITLGVQPRTLLQNVSQGPLHHQLEKQPLEAILPLACPPVQPQDSLNSLSRNLQQLLEQLSKHADTPLQQILSEVGCSSNSSDAHHPVFQAGLIVAGNQQGGLQAAASAAAALDVALLWYVPETADGLVSEPPAPSLRLLYNMGLLLEESAALLAEHFKVFLNNALIHPDAPLLDLPLMGQREQLQVLRGFNQTDRPYDTAALVHMQFAQHAATTPDAVAVAYEGVSYSYAEINTRANRIANHLLSLGVGPGSIVGVLLLRSPNMIAALLGVWKAGAAYLPLDHQHPEARIALMLEDAAVQVVLVQPDLTWKLPPQPEQQRLGLIAAQLTAHDLGEAAAADPCWNGGELTTPDSSCYIIYTSGSTGRPKGCQVKHAGLTAYIAWLHSHFGITPADVFIQKTPTNFDASVDEMWAALSAGATLVVAPAEAHRDVHTVMDLITRYNVTTASFVPSQLHVLAREITALHSSADIAAGAAPCASLKRVLSGGEALTSTAAADIRSALPRCQLWNTYGPTETTVGITCWLYEPASAGSSNTVPIGRGIHNSRLYVLDSKMQPVPIGVPGQLFISGVCVSAGYLNRPDLNADVFLPNPFHHMEIPGSNTQIMYRTGDLVRWLPGHDQGALEFLGRIDHQVKLRGFRIELQEVEAAAAALPGVCQVATAVVRSAITQQDHLAAWISPDSLDSKALISGLAEKLPHYMIPTVIVPLAALPLLPSEKINRKALPAPDWSRHMVTAVGLVAANSSGSSTGPAEPVCKAQEDSDLLLQYLQTLWADILGLSASDITPSSDFFACGGNSLLVGVMNSRVRARLSAPGMSGLLLYQHPALQEFAAAVRAAVGQLPSDLTACISRRSDDSYDRLVITTRVGGSDDSSSSGGSVEPLTECHSLDEAMKSEISAAWGTAGKVALEISNTGVKKQQKAMKRYETASMVSATVLQLIGAVFGLSVQFLMGLAPMLVFEAIFIQWGWKALALQPAVEFVLLLVHLFVAWAAKWVLVGRYREGVHGIYGSFYIRHWLANLLAMDARVYTLPLLKRTVLLNYYYRAMGMTVSSSACIQSIELCDHDLVTVEDGACIEPRSIVSAGTYTARQAQDAKKYPFGTMTLKAVRIGKNTTIATQAQVNSCTIPEDAVVEPCSASSHPARNGGESYNSKGAAVRTADKPLGVISAMSAVLVFCVVSSIMYMPAIVGSILIWDQLTDSTDDVLDTISTALSCWFRLPDTISDMDICSQIMVSELISMLPYIGFLYIMGQVAVLAMIPIKWLLLGKVTPAKAQQQNSWWHFRLHLYSCLVDHPLVRLGAFLWSGTEMYNMWLRGLGMKVGRQAWIGEDLMCSVPDLVEIGDCVSITSGVGMFPLTSSAAKTIKLHPGCDVTNQTALFPGVQVKPQAVVGVLTYAAEDRTFMAGSITQGSLVLRPGVPDPSPEDEESASNTLAFMGQKQLSPADEAVSRRLVGRTRYLVFNVLYALAIWVLVPVSDAMFTIPLYTVVLAALYQGGLLLLVAAMPIAFMVAVAFLMTWLVLVKRLLIPRCEGTHRLYTYKPTAWMMYGIVLLVHESTLIRGLMGSQLGVWFYRALGAKIGGNTCLLGPLYNQEPDCVSIGDYTVMEEDSFVMAHTVEDRRLKFLDVKIGKCVSVGAGSCIMPGASVEDGAFVGDVSLVMKGEVVPAGCHWSGVPAVPHQEDAPTVY